MFYPNPLQPILRQYIAARILAGHILKDQQQLSEGEGVVAKYYKFVTKSKQYFLSTQYNKNNPSNKNSQYTTNTHVHMLKQKDKRTR